MENTLNEVEHYINKRKWLTKSDITKCWGMDIRTFEKYYIECRVKIKTKKLGSKTLFNKEDVVKLLDSIGRPMRDLFENRSLKNKKASTAIEA